MAHRTDKKIIELPSGRTSGTQDPARISVSVHEQHAPDSDIWTDSSRWPAIIVALPMNCRFVFAAKDMAQQLRVLSSHRRPKFDSRTHMTVQNYL